jgi:hypothetical protein
VSELSQAIDKYLLNERPSALKILLRPVGEPVSVLPMPKGGVPKD